MNDKFSLTTTGILLAIAGPALAHFGFSQQCSGEISGIVVPALATLPGAIVAQVGRWRVGKQVQPGGDVSLLGFKKPGRSYRDFS